MRFPFFLLFFMLLSVVPACHAAPEKSVISKVNGVEITKDDFVSRLREYRAGNDSPLGTPAEAAELKDRILRELIEESVLIQEAKKRKISVSAEELEKGIQEVMRDYPQGGFEEMLSSQKMSRSRWRQRMETKLLLEKVTSAITQGGKPPTSQAIEAYYKSHPDDFRLEERWHLAQMVLKSKEDADRVQAEMAAGKSFEELARVHSFTPEAAQGGDLGFLPRGAMPKPVEDAVEKLQVGKISGAIESEYGFHIVRLLERKPAARLTLADAAPSIVKILTQQERDARFAVWRQETLSKAKIERNHGLLDSIR